jgi:hypothetical protein
MCAAHTGFLLQMLARPRVGVAWLVLGQASVAGAFTDPDTGDLRPLRRVTVLGEAVAGVSL